MKEHPILFSGEMVRMILIGIKTKTRRVIEPQPNINPSAGWRYDGVDEEEGGHWIEFLSPDGRRQTEEYMRIADKCPFGEKGDRLWVRETWAEVPETAYRMSTDIYQQTNPHDKNFVAVYKEGWTRCAPYWKPSIHMPRWASRITLEITDVRVEWLRNISLEDKIAEGFCDCARSYPCDVLDKCDEHCFMRTWDTLDAKKGFGWGTNPYVWVISFRRLKNE
jgi:hypothetical protein